MARCQSIVKANYNSQKLERDNFLFYYFIQMENNYWDTCHECKSCKSCSLCSTSTYCKSCETCDYSTFCNSCTYCTYCKNCDYCKNLERTEYNYFCWSTEYYSDTSFKQPHYRVFNVEVPKEEYEIIKKIHHTLEFNVDKIGYTRFQNAFKKMWGKLTKKEKKEYYDIPHFNREWFTYITWIKKN